MILILISLFGSCVLLILIAGLAASRHGVGGVCTALGAVIAVTFLAFPSGAVFLQCVLTIIAVLVVQRYSAKPRTIVLVSGAMMALSYGLVLLLSYPALLEQKQLRREYPLVSVADRLGYEETLGEGEGREEVILSPDVERQLVELERESWRGMRSHMLASLHSRTSDEFVLARGFGPVRMFGVRRERIELPEPQPVPLPQQEQPSYAPGTGTVVPLADTAADELIPEREQLAWLHTTGVQDFLSPDRMGYVQDRHHVAGFLSHQFTAMPEVPAKEGRTAQWQIVRLDLVSLLKHEQPVAYVSSHLPRMDELQHAPTRPLDLFEAQAVERLRSQEDLVTEEEVDRIRMVGSLRAGKGCLECHSGRRGQLLGAFSYELVPAEPVPQPQNATAGPPA